jgi:hypothetical protein
VPQLADDGKRDRRRTRRTISHSAEWTHHPARAVNGYD